MPKIKDLAFGQYFQCEDIIARLLGDTIVFLNSKLILHNQLSCCCDADDLNEENVTPIDLQAVILLLVKECLLITDNAPECDPNNKVEPSDLKPGQFFINERGVVGLIFSNDRACYINDSYSGCWDYLTSIHQVVPLTMHQAVLSLIQTFVGNEHTTLPRIKLIASPVIKWFNADYEKYKEMEYQQVYEQYYLQHEGKYWK